MHLLSQIRRPYRTISYSRMIFFVCALSVLIAFIAKCSLTSICSVCIRLSSLISVHTYRHLAPVESDYTVIFFAAGCQYSPSLNWIRKAYRSLSRKYRKNLKKLVSAMSRLKSWNN